MKLKIWIALVLVSAISLTAQADVFYAWTHDGRAEDGTDIPNVEIAFQIEYSVQGGPLSYTDVPAGTLGADQTNVRYRDPLTLMCAQTLISRVRALWEGQYSDWSAQANATAPACPAPTSPENHSSRIPGSG